MEDDWELYFCLGGWRASINSFCLPERMGWIFRVSSRLSDKSYDDYSPSSIGHSFAIQDSLLSVVQNPLPQRSGKPVLVRTNPCFELLFSCEPGRRGCVGLPSLESASPWFVKINRYLVGVSLSVKMYFQNISKHFSFNWRGNRSLLLFFPSWIMAGMLMRKPSGSE